MIVDERMVTYIRSLEVPESAVIEAIEQEALRDRVPIIRKEMQSFLKVLLMIKRPMRILEVGAAVGFSSILMSEYMPKGGHITTIENYDKRIPIARANFKRAGKEEQIDLIEGDALEVMHGLEGPYDLIFVERRNRTIHSRMREYLYELKHHDQLQTSIIPLGDGVALSVKRSDI